MAIIFQPTGSLNVATDPSLLAEEKGNILTGTQGDIVSGAMSRCKNLRLDRDGLVQTRYGAAKASDTAIEKNITNIIEQAGHRYAFSGGAIYRDEEILGSGYSTARWSAILYNAFNDTAQQVFALNGTDRKRIDGSTIYEWGMEAPTVAPEIFAGCSAGNLTGTINVKYTYARKSGSLVICESNPSEEGTAVAVTADHLQATAAYPDDETVTHLRFYRTLDGGEVYYYDGDITPAVPLSAADYAYAHPWEGDGSPAVQYCVVLGTVYAYSHDWEESGAYTAGVGYAFTTIDTTVTDSAYAYCHDWEEEDAYIVGTGFLFAPTADARHHTADAHWWEEVAEATTARTITDWAITGPGDYDYKDDITDNCFSWEHRYGTGITITIWALTAPDDTPHAPDMLEEYDYCLAGTGHLFTEAADVKECVYSWEPDVDTTEMHRNVTMFAAEPVYYVINTATGSLGSEVEETHDRPPLGAFVTGPNYNGTCFIVKDNLLYYCLPKQPEYWPSLYYVEVSAPQFPGQCVVFWNGTPYYLTRTEIYQVQGTGHLSFFPYRMEALTGTQGPQGACGVHGQGIFHRGSDGVYLFNGQVDKKISQAEFDPVFRGDTVNGVPGATAPTNDWIVQLGNCLYVGYTSFGCTYPTNVLAINLDTGRTAYYAYPWEMRTVAVDFTSSRLLAGCTDGYVREIEAAAARDDDGAAIAWEVQSKNYELQTRAHFPRSVKYDVDASRADSAYGYLILDEAVHQTHALTENRQTRKRLVTTGNGNRAAIRLAGEGAVAIYMVEAE